MPEFDTTHFGRISYDDAAPFDFPSGLPGFERLRSFLPLTFPDREPLVFLQSLEDPCLCFVTIPVLAADPQYRLELTPDDLGLIGLPPRPQPRFGTDVLCLAMLSFREDGPTANLLAPIVVNLRNRRSVQAIAPGAAYSHQHALFPAGCAETQAAPC